LSRPGARASGYCHLIERRHIELAAKLNVVPQGGEAASDLVERSLAAADRTSACGRIR
jgi:hypothetical protein